MENFRKAMIMLAAAITMDALGTQAAMAAKNDKPRDPPKKGKVQAKKEAKVKSKRVVKVRRASKRPAWSVPDLGMPAGTLYDVVRVQDLA